MHDKFMSGFKAVCISECLFLKENKEIKSTPLGMGQNERIYYLFPGDKDMKS